VLFSQKRLFVIEMQDFWLMRKIIIAKMQHDTSDIENESKTALIINTIQERRSVKYCKRNQELH